MSVYLDGQFAFGASALVIAARHVGPGCELTAEEIETLQEAETAERAYNSALNFLSFRPRSTRELEDYFRRRGIEADIAGAAIERLQRSNLLNDEEFARFWIDNRQSFRPRGARALRDELRQKGLAGEIIDEALESIGDEGEVAVSAGRKKMGSYRTLDDRTFLTRMIGFLQRRGFSYRVADRAARELLVERGGDLPADEGEFPVEDIPTD